METDQAKRATDELASWDRHELVTLVRRMYRQRQELQIKLKTSEANVEKLKKYLQEATDRSEALLRFFEQSKNFMRLRKLSLVAQSAMEMVEDIEAHRFDILQGSYIQLKKRIQALAVEFHPPKGSA